jgi:hypothetical protein
MTHAERIALAVVLAASGLALDLPCAYAQSAEAEVLFRDGRNLIRQGNLGVGCDKLAASEALETSIGTLLNLGDCREQNGQIATAWKTFLDAAALAQDNPKERKRADEARRRASYLQPRLSYLTISVSDASDIDGLTITRDGAPVDRAFWNQGVPVDGGTYVIEASAPGHDAWRTSIVVAPENAHAMAEVPRFKPIEELAPAVAPPPVAPPPPPRHTTRAPHHPHAHRSRWTTMRFASLGSAAVSLGAIAFGAIEGLAANDEANQSRARCDADCSDPEIDVLNARSSRHALYSNLSFAGAAVAAAGAVTLWILGKPSAEVQLSPDIGRDHVALALTLEL